VDAPAARGHCLFDTAIGRCAIAWGPAGIVAVQLPEADDAATRRRLFRNAGEAPPAAEPPPQVQDAIAGVVALMAGERRDLLEVALDMARVSAFRQRVYQFARRIPPGQTRTYGEVAQALGDPPLARAVGQAMGANPFAPIVPCHRVMAAGGQPGGFSARGGAMTKLRMLGIEGALEPDLFDPPPPGLSR
jgi:methylated-DNA-[protein]-cysteine S-methyltransferase